MTGGPAPSGDAYSTAALARLALSDRARDLADETMLLIPTLDDREGSAAQHLAQALRVRAAAGQVVSAAIRNARAQGLDWGEIALYCGIRTNSVVERWEPEEQRWAEILRRAQHPDPGAGHPDPEDPDEIPMVYAPEPYAVDLDAWAARHLDPFASQRWEAEGKDPSRAVSGGLPPA